VFDLLASRDGGATFRPLQLNLPSPSTTVETSRLGGGSTIFRVVAHDGVHTAEADSKPVSLANKPPQVFILAPGNGAHLLAGQPIHLSGMVEDLQADGDLQGEDLTLTWSSQQGVLGSGAALEVAALPLGQHTITLTAKNKAGLTASTSITVMVESPLFPPGPSLAVGPTQVGWHVANGSTEPQQAVLHLSTSSADIDWVASSNAPWLKLSAASGRGNADLTLSADSSGAPADTTLRALVTLTGKVAGRVVQTIQVPVSLSLGFVWPSGGTPPATPVVQTSLSQLNMLFAAGATEPQSVEMAIENMGSGDFTWSATCDWQRMSMSVAGSAGIASPQTTVSGSGPARLTLTVDPAGLEPGSSRTVEMVLNLNVPGQAAQTMTIPVSVDVEANPDDGPNDELASPTRMSFLPLVSR
jgi:hypothetical protein